MPTRTTHTVYWDPKDIVILKSESKRLWADFHRRVEFVTLPVAEAMRTRLNLLDAAIALLTDVAD